MAQNRKMTEIDSPESEKITERRKAIGDEISDIRRGKKSRKEEGDNWAIQHRKWLKTERRENKRYKQGLAWIARNYQKVEGTIQAKR